MSNTVELSADQWEEKLWGSYCYGLGENTPEDCNTDDLLMVWTHCGHCSAPGMEGRPFILCFSCHSMFGQLSAFDCSECGMSDKDFLMVTGMASAEFAEAGREARAWAEYVPRKERRKADRSSLVKSGRGRGKRRG